MTRIIAVLGMHRSGTSCIDQLTRAFRRLRLHPERGELGFFDDSLRNQTAADDRRLPPHILSLYRRLQERAL